jgi:hypothetical protein
MIPEEAVWLRRVIEARRPEQILDCGSAAAYYRTCSQPCIAELFRDCSVTHLDVRAAPGVDLVADICRAADLPVYPLVVCANLLEHVTEVDAALANVCRAVGRDLILTVPNRWPRHGGYYNGFRPTLGELCHAVEKYGLVVRMAELLDGGGPFSGRRVSMLHAEREAAAP